MIICRHCMEDVPNFWNGTFCPNCKAEGDYFTRLDDFFQTTVFYDGKEIVLTPDNLLDELDKFIDAMSKKKPSR